MVINKVQPREMGRPRTFTDDVVLAATARAVVRLGYAHLTVEAVAAEVGCTGPALIRRFGSKRGLLRAYLERAEAVGRDRFRAIRQTHASPLEALRARFRIPTEERPDELAPPAGYVNLILFHLAAWADPDLRDGERRLRAMFTEEIAALLQAATAAGELVPYDPARLARTLLAALTGTALMWASDPDRRIEEQLVDVLDEVVGPYRVAKAIPPASAPLGG